MKAITMAEKVLDKAVNCSNYTVKTRLVHPTVEIIDGDGFTIFEYVKSGRGNESMYFESGNRGFHYLFGNQRKEKDYWTSDIQTGDMSDVEISDFEKAFDEFLEIL